MKASTIGAPRTPSGSLESLAMYPASFQRRRAALIVITAAASVGLSGCADLAAPRSITLDEAALQTFIAKRFPFDRRMLEVLDVKVDTPRVRLLPESNRIATDFSLAATDRLFGRSAAGQLALESALRYDETERAVRLAQVRVTRLQLDGAPANVQTTVGRFGAILAEQVLEGLPVYRFKPEDLERAQRRGLQPGAVTVTPRGVEITLVPARP